VPLPKLLVDFGEMNAVESQQDLAAHRLTRLKLQRLLPCFGFLEREGGDGDLQAVLVSVITLTKILTEADRNIGQRHGGELG
jgi:hypothetical protein